ncbi:MAG: MoaD/ThiS family protein [Eubacteriales bacterium]|nr:MoaD/ThiS family protein [Eubacteriales bacterium]
MMIEISEVLLKGSDISSPVEVRIDQPTTVDELMIRIGLIHKDYGVYFVNDKLVERTHIVDNDDRMIVLPLFGGG